MEYLQVCLNCTDYRLYKTEGQSERCPKLKPKCLTGLLVVGCSIGQKPRLLSSFRSDLGWTEPQSTHQIDFCVPTSWEPSSPRTSSENWTSAPSTKKHNRGCKFNLPKTMTVHFYIWFRHWILNSSITIWYTAATAEDKSRLQSIKLFCREDEGVSPVPICLQDPEVSWKDWNLPLLPQT